ncbi:hypothetical protein [Clostridium botulinum]|uniref:hypothetical protein n=1 Tax=Clostridium botulinum TaxID=1491 RepID=UPI0021BF2EA2|nr:hypothetical protein [Clostridium botulinum]
MDNMDNNILRTIPSLYLANYLNDFEDLLAKYDIVKKIYKKGEVLTQYGTISETAYYMKNGIMHLSIGHEEGEKSICLLVKEQFSRLVWNLVSSRWIMK